MRSAEQGRQGIISEFQKDFPGSNIKNGLEGVRIVIGRQVRTLSSSLAELMAGNRHI